jgi:hypothetical protein
MTNLFICRQEHSRGRLHPVARKSGVQFHDILYKMFRDILYTLARGDPRENWVFTAVDR